MKKKLLLIMVILLGLSLTSCDLLNKEATTTEVPIIVETDTLIEVDTVEELQAMEINKSYKLTADIDLTDIDWDPIGTYHDPFLANFDGNGFTISNLTITDDDSLYNGLFGYITGDVFDLTLTNVSIDYKTSFLTYAGAVAGFSTGDITNISVEANISVESDQSNAYVGLLVGYTQASLENITVASDFETNKISNNLASGSVTVLAKNIAFVGGLIGKTFNSEVTDNFVDVVLDVELDEYFGYIGGLIGHHYGGILIGFEDQVEDPNIYISNNVVYSTITASINGEDLTVSGLIGYNQYAYVSDNYVKTDISIEGSGLDTSEIYRSGFIGQNWSSEVVHNVVDFSITNSVDDYAGLHDELVIVAYQQSDKTFEGNKVNDTLAELDISTIAGLDLISNTDLVDADFYRNTMEWEDSQINKIIN